MTFFTSNNQFYFTSVKISSFAFQMELSGCSCFLNGVEHQGTFPVNIGDRYFITTTDPSAATIVVDGVTQSISVRESITTFDVSKLIRMLKGFFLEYPVDSELYSGVLITDLTGFIKLDVVEDIVLSFESKFDRILYQLNQWVSDLAFSNSEVTLSYRTVSDVIKSTMIQVELNADDIQDTKSDYTDTSLTEFEYYPTIIKMEQIVREFITDSELLDIARDLYNVVWLPSDQTYTPTSLMVASDVSWVQQRMVELGISVQLPSQIDAQDDYIKKVDLLVFTNEALGSLVQGLLKRISDRVEYSSSVLIEDLSIDNQISTTVVDLNAESEYQVTLLSEIIKLDNPAFVSMAIDGFEDMVSSLSHISKVSDTVANNIGYTQIDSAIKPIPLDYSTSVASTQVAASQPTESVSASEQSGVTVTDLHPNDISSISPVELASRAEGLSVDALDKEESSSLKSNEGAEILSPWEYTKVDQTQETQIQDSETITPSLGSSQLEVGQADAIDTTSSTSVDSSKSLDLKADTSSIKPSPIDGSPPVDINSSNPVLNDGFSAISQITESPKGTQSVSSISMTEGDSSLSTSTTGSVETDSKADINIIEFAKMELESAVVEVEFKDFVNMVNQAEVEPAKVNKATVEVLTDITHEDVWRVVDSKEVVVQNELTPQTTPQTETPTPIQGELVPQVETKSPTLLEVESAVDYQNISTASLQALEDYLARLMQEAGIQTTTLSQLTPESTVEDRLIQIQLASAMLADRGIQNDPVVQAIQSAFQMVVVSGVPLGSLVITDSLLSQLIPDSVTLRNLYSAILFDSTTHAFDGVDVTSDAQAQVTSFMLESVLSTREDGSVVINADLFNLVGELYSPSVLMETLTKVAQQSPEMGIAAEKFISAILSNDASFNQSLTAQDIPAISALLRSLSSELISEFAFVGSFRSSEVVETLSPALLLDTFSDIASQRLLVNLGVDATTIANVSIAMSADFEQYSKVDHSSGIDLQSMFINFIESSVGNGLLYGIPVTQDVRDVYQTSLISSTDLEGVFGTNISPEQEALLAEMRTSITDQRIIVGLMDPNLAAVDYSVTSAISDGVESIISDVIMGTATAFGLPNTQVPDKSPQHTSMIESILADNPEVVALLATSILSSVVSIGHNEASSSQLTSADRQQIETLISTVEREVPLIKLILNSTSISEGAVESLMDRAQSIARVDSSVSSRPQESLINIDVSVLGSTALDAPIEILGAIEIQNTIRDVSGEIFSASEIMTFSPTDTKSAIPVEMSNDPTPNPVREELELALLWLKRRLIQQQITIASTGSKPALEQVVELNLPLPAIPLVGLSVAPVVVNLDLKIKDKVATVAVKLSSAEVEVASNILKLQVAKSQIAELKATVAKMAVDIEATNAQLGEISTKVESAQTTLDEAAITDISLTQKIQTALISLEGLTASLEPTAQMGVDSSQSKLGQLESTLVSIDRTLSSVNVFDLAKTSALAESTLKLQSIKNTLNALQAEYTSLKTIAQLSTPLINQAASSILGLEAITTAELTASTQETSTNPTTAVTRRVDELQQPVLVDTAELQETANRVEVSQSAKEVAQSKVEDIVRALQEAEANISNLAAIKGTIATGVDQLSKVIDSISTDVEAASVVRDQTSPLETEVKYSTVDGVNVGTESKTDIIQKLDTKVAELKSVGNISEPVNVDTINQILGELLTSTTSKTDIKSALEVEITNKTTILGAQELTALELVKVVQAIQNQVTEFKNAAGGLVPTSIGDMTQALSEVKSKALDILTTIAEVKLMVHVKDHLVELPKMSDAPKQTVAPIEDESDLVYLSWMPKSRMLMYGDNWEKYAVAPFPVDFYFIDRYRELYACITPGNTYDDEMAYLAHITRMYGSYIKGAVF